MSLTQPQLDDLVALLSESLRAAAGRTLDDLVIAERARNAAQLLNVAYEMRPLTEARRAEFIDRRTVAAYLVDRADQYETHRWEWNPLIEAAKALVNGEFDAAVTHGELEDAELLRRVDRWSKP